MFHFLVYGLVLNGPWEKMFHGLYPMMQCKVANSLRHDRKCSKAWYHLAYGPVDHGPGSGKKRSPPLCITVHSQVVNFP